MVSLEWALTQLRTKLIRQCPFVFHTRLWILTSSHVAISSMPERKLARLLPVLRLSVSKVLEQFAA